MRAVLATVFFCALHSAAHAETASYYGFESGRHTASGERFDPNAMAAAHRTLPFGTLLRVTYQGLFVQKADAFGVAKICASGDKVFALSHYALATDCLFVPVCIILAWSSSARNGLLIKQVTPACLA
jgi:Lytic transglycolase